MQESKDHGITGDYVVSYKNTAKAGTATIIFKGINEYSGELKKTYKITAQEISNGENALHEGMTMTYTTEEAASKPVTITDLSEITSPYMKGGAKPQISLYYNGITLIPGRDYTVSYKNNTTVPLKLPFPLMVSFGSLCSGKSALVTVVLFLYDTV